MTEDKILAWLGIVISVPPFLLLFIEGRTVVGLSGLAFVALLVAVYIWVRSPVFTLLEVEKALTFPEDGPAKATLVDRRIARANHRGLTEFRWPDISNDGTAESVLVDGQPPDEERVKAGDPRVCKRFPHALRRGECRELTMTLTLRDCFPANTEGMIHTVDFDTKHLKMTAYLPPSKKCHAARAYLRYAGRDERELPKPEVSEGGRKLVLKADKLRPRTEYLLEWDW